MPSDHMVVYTLDGILHFRMGSLFGKEYAQDPEHLDAQVQEICSRYKARTFEWLK